MPVLLHLKQVASTQVGVFSIRGAGTFNGIAPSSFMAILRY